METADTVHDRIERAGTELTPTRAALAIGLAAALGFTLMFLQDPMAHDAMHNFRHAAGVTCH
ncbi:MULTISPECIES: CbtB domain-containing protein [Halostella]|uniref:CbtB domain-containing protein n=1 Tax=Halostella TaxID=1843185 RepID=UPI000EF80E97|nr:MULTISPECIES: CbtB domain-containing protein [Halostella]NHN47825.1 CbtB-domain containing protein [Halostella sp. JP-L12]